MYEFLGAASFAYDKGAFGKANRLFAVLQLQFSHLVLNPSSEWCQLLKPQPKNYDLARVYLVNKLMDMELLYREVSRSDEQDNEKIWQLDVETLLHIRNFWQAHFAASADSKYAVRAVTYGKMVQDLHQRGHPIKSWEVKLGQPADVAATWFGHYSCSHLPGRTHPRNEIGPRLETINEHPTCAEDWVNNFGENGVHPLNLDLDFTKCADRHWWPPIFSEISEIKDLPASIFSEPEANNVQYIRGVAPFLSPQGNPSMYGRFTALRVRGFIHSIPDQEGIPGWQRIVMVFYELTARYLLTVLNASSPRDIEVFEQWNDPSNPSGLAQPNDPPNGSDADCELELKARNAVKGPLGPALLTRDFIRELEDHLHPADELLWDDLKRCYVYEGAVLPGGKIMMGRYWRIYWEPDEEHDGAWFAHEWGNGEDRGPWIFWS